MRHAFRLNPNLFTSMLDGALTFDLRAGEFQVGELVRYDEFDYENRCATGRWLEVLVTFVVASDLKGISAISLAKHRVPRPQAA